MRSPVENQARYRLANFVWTKPLDSLPVGPWAQLVIMILSEG